MRRVKAVFEDWRTLLKELKEAVRDVLLEPVILLLLLVWLVFIILLYFLYLEEASLSFSPSQYL